MNERIKNTHGVGDPYAYGPESSPADDFVRQLYSLTLREARPVPSIEEVRSQLREYLGAFTQNAKVLHLGEYVGMGHIQTGYRPLAYALGISQAVSLGKFVQQFRAAGVLRPQRIKKSSHPYRHLALNRMDMYAVGALWFTATKFFAGMRITDEAEVQAITDKTYEVLGDTKLAHYLKVQQELENHYPKRSTPSPFMIPENFEY